MQSTLPRPILKHSNSHPIHRNAVHFPPSPLTRTFSAHSSATYDRSPIVVSPNSCAIPPRGCPGRTYSIDDQRPNNGRVLHPRALDNPPLPPLILDLSSESEESDGFLSSPSDPVLSTCSIPLQYPIYPYPQHHPTALAFLPHPQSYSTCYESDDPQPKSRKRPQRRPERSRDRDRIRPTVVDGGERDDEAESPVSPRSTRHARIASTFAAQDADVGCLGGF